MLGIGKEYVDWRRLCRPPFSYRQKNVSLMLLVLRNAFEIVVLTAVNHSETDWNIRHAFRIWAYTDYFGSPTTPLMSVFGVRSECAETPKKKIKNRK